MSVTLQNPLKMLATKISAVKKYIEINGKPILKMLICSTGI